MNSAAIFLKQLTTILLLLISGNQAENFRLPGDIIPEYYDLRILTNLKNINDTFNFIGDVGIRVNVLNETNRIVLHSHELKIDKENVRIYENATLDACRKNNPGVESLKVANQIFDDDSEFYTIETTSKLQEGQQYVICINFEGNITQGLAGYYRSSYKDKTSGETKWLAVTQFESTDARRAFPCFDEPAMKARFEVTLGHTKSTSAISNMPVASVKPIEGMDGWVWERFEPTVPMSTYLLAYLVSEFDYRTSSRKASNNVEFRTWARKDAVSQVAYANEIGPKILEDYELYFNEKFPLPKQDMVAIPDFSAGAMENWGLVTYRETALLFDVKVTSSSKKPYVASVIGHELAHQWFGNLVTMKWWTDLWLNEGFATYVENQETDKIEPKWKYLDTSIVNNYMTIMTLDALNSSHPISVPVKHPREIAQIFDTISYKKGSFIIRMMNLFLGEETFRNGVSNYLRKHKYGNAEQDDLWASLTEEAHKNNVLPKNMTVKEIMDTWTLQTGYPLLTVTRDYEKGTATITQERFFADQATPSDESSWWIPITYTTSSELDFNNTMPRIWLPKGQKSIQISGIPKDDWLLLNVKLSGLYRVNYDAANWQKLSSAIKSENFGGISTLNRVQIIDEAMDFARFGVIEYSVPFQILTYLSNETEVLPWQAAIAGLAHLNVALYGYPIYGSFRSYLKTILLPIYNKTAWVKLDESPENLNKIKLQTMITALACQINLSDCRARAIHMYRQWMTSSNPDGDNPIPNDWSDVVYCYAIQEGGEDEWNFAWKRYLNANAGAIKADLLDAMTCTKEVWLINRYLQWSIDEKSEVRKQDSRNIFLGIAKTDLGYYLAKTFFLRNIQHYQKHYSANPSTMAYYLKALVSHITTQADLDELKEFTTKNREYLKGVEQGIKQSLESAKINVQWHNQHYKKLLRILADPDDNLV